MGPERSPTRGFRMGPANLVRGCELNPPAHAFHGGTGRAAPGFRRPDVPRSFLPALHTEAHDDSGGENFMYAHGTQWPVVMSIVAIDSGALGGQHGLGLRGLRPKPVEYRSAVPKAVGRIQIVRDAVDREC